MKNLTAVILAAGVGKRFWPFITPKLLFPFMGKSFFEWVVPGQLVGIEKIIVVANSQNEKSLMLSSPHKTIIQKNANGMADALLTSEKEIHPGPLLVLNGDDLSVPNVIPGLLEHALSSSSFGVIPGFKIKTYEDFGYLVAHEGKVKKIIEKPGRGKEPSSLAFMVSYFVRDSAVLFDALHKTKDHEQALSSLMVDNVFDSYEYKGNFASLKYPQHVLSVMEILLSDIKTHRGTNVKIKSNVIIEGEVWIDDNVTIYENTKIIGPCYIGPNTIIGNNNLIRESHIGSDCVTGFNTDITRSYVGNNCWFHSNYIGDSVLESNISLGGGTKLANLRLDEGEIQETGRTKLGAMIGSDVHVGVNTSIMPGVKIGGNSFIGAGIVLDKDVPEQSFCVGTSTISFKKNTRSVVKQSREEFLQKMKKYV